MRIPFWQREQAHPTKAIDRLQNSRSSRQLIGIWTAHDFEKIVASLVRVKGSGKYARFVEKDSITIELEDSAQKTFRDLANDSSPRESDILFAGTELAAYQADGCLRLLARNGVTASELVAVGAIDPGLEIVDFEGKPLYRSLTNSVELATRTSITVIDRFAERDILDGGTGNNLLALGYWFLLGDRNPRVSEEDRLLVLNAKPNWQVYFLPASDGLDAKLPEIGFFNLDDGQDHVQSVNQIIDQCLASRKGLRLRVIFEKESGIKTSQTDDRVASSSLEEFGIQNIDSVATAFMANSFIDQLPVSIPDLTGNQNPKVLGSLTPGSLVNFRNFVHQSSKVTPSIMKLRDAI